jgi:hypothetical protein
MSIASAHELTTPAHQGINGLTAYEISKVDMNFDVLIIEPVDMVLMLACSLELICRICQSFNDIFLL